MEALSYGGSGGSSMTGADWLRLLPHVEGKAEPYSCREEGGRRSGTPWTRSMCRRSGSVGNLGPVGDLRPTATGC